MLFAAYRLAFLFRRPLHELKMGMSEFAAWLAYLNLEPPDEGDNRRTAALMAQITNMSGRSLPDKKRVSADDFLGKKSKRQTAAEQLAFMKSLGK